MVGRSATMARSSCPVQPNVVSGPQQEMEDENDPDVGNLAGLQGLRRPAVVHDAVQVLQ